MKRIIIILVAFVALITCSKENSFVLSEQDRETLEKMDIYLKNAEIYNDSIEFYYSSDMDSIDSVYCYYYDSLLHDCHSMFETYHHQFAHDNTHCLNDGNRSGGMMGEKNNHCNSGYQHDMGNYDDADKSHMDEHYNQMIRYYEQMEQIIGSHIHLQH